MGNTNFYTLDDDEATAAVTNMGATSEDDPFQVLVSSGSDLVPMYRMRSTTNGSHLFTTFLDERDVAVNEDGFIPEGIGFWCQGPDGMQPANWQSLFRLYNTKTGDFFYTIDPNESAANYARQGIAGFTSIVQAPNTFILYRLLSPDGMWHFYTASHAEMLDLTNLVPKWTLESTCGYVYTAAPAGPQPFFRSYNPATGGHLYTLSIAEHDNATIVDGYRGDGMSGYIWPTGAQPATASELVRYYKPGSNDHFYTTSTILGPAGYNHEGTAGWVPSAPVAGSTTPMHRLVGDFVNDFLLLAPAQGLLGNSNFVMTNQLKEGLAQPILGVDVELDITTSPLAVASVDTGDPGCSLQLNCYSPQGFNSAWQQYTLFLDNGNLNWEIQNWIAGIDANPYSPRFIRDSGWLASLDGNALPSGIRLRIALIYDAYGFVLGANFFAYQGAATLGQKQMLIQDILGPAVSGVAFGSAPILAFQSLLVGTGNGSTTTFAQGGVGILRYKATSPLQATTQLPANVGFHVTGTGENSNIIYGQVSATFSKTHTQTVGV
jgi:uncharacterized protein DUF5648